MYDFASACQILLARAISAQTSSVGRRPKTSEQGMMTKLAYPREMTVTPV